jgi:hypothetical protein
MPCTARVAPEDALDIQPDRPNARADGSGRSVRAPSPAPAENTARDLPAEPLVFQVWRALANATQKSAELARSLADTRQCIDQLRGELEEMRKQTHPEGLN